MLATPQRHPVRSPRAGFTLIEIMVVIVIITILVALLLPAIFSSRKRVRVAEVRSEISALETAIGGFKADFGIEPPGSIRIFNSAAGWNTTGSTTAAEAIRVQSRSYLRQLWPQFDFNAAYSAQPGGANITSATGYIDLNGAECLVFFLGGPSSPSSKSPIGFSKSATSPFSQAGTNRIQPYYSFPPQRLVDKDGDGMNEFVDTIPSQSSPYLYFSSNGGQGYSTAINPPGSSSPTDWCNTDNYYDGYLQNSTWATPSWAGNWMKHMYYSTSSSTGVVFTDMSASVPFAPQKFQIISPGFGGIGAGSPLQAYGSGGYYDPTNISSLSGTADGDNITNIAPNTLSGE